MVSRCLLAEGADEGQLKVHAWLLCTLTSSHLSAAVRSAVAASPPVLRRLTEMLHCQGAVSAGVFVWGSKSVRVWGVRGKSCLARMLGRASRGPPHRQEVWKYGEEIYNSTYRLCFCAPPSLPTTPPRLPPYQCLAPTFPQTPPPSSPAMQFRNPPPLPCPLAVPGATLAAMAIGNIARGGALCQRMLVQAGAIKKLLACLAGPHAVDHKVRAARIGIGIGIRIGSRICGRTRQPQEALPRVRPAQPQACLQPCTS